VTRQNTKDSLQGEKDDKPMLGKNKVQPTFAESGSDWDSDDFSSSIEEERDKSCMGRLKRLS